MKKWSVFALWFASFSTFASSSDFSWHGYISQGITQSKDSSFITDNDDVTGELTEIGLNGYYQLAENISIAGQINYLDGGNRFEQGARLDYLFVDWKLPNFILRYEFCSAHGINLLKLEGHSCSGPSFF